MKDFYFTHDEHQEDLIEDKDKCADCIHFDLSSNLENGECICVMSKFYKDIMVFEDSCDYFTRGNNDAQ
jgi:hypothetical protein